MAAFTAGNIVIYRVGTGTGALSNAATAVFLDEYTPAGVFVQSIALPTTANAGTTGNDALTASGTAGSEGEISNSANGQDILLAGYNVSAGTAAVAGTSSATTPPTNQRVIGVVNAAGNVDTTTNVGAFDSANNPRSAASVDGNNLYIGTQAGVATTTDGSTATPTANAASGPTTIDATNTRQTEVVTFNGTNTLYYSTGANSAGGIYTLGATPTTTQSTSTTTDTGTLLAASPAPYGFYFANLGTAKGAQPDTLYVVDTTNGIEKFVFNGTNYTAAGAITTATSLTGTSVTLTGTGNTTQLSGITGVVTPGSGGGAGSVTLFVTTGSGLYKLTDSGTGTLAGPATQIAAAPTNTVFRGDAAAPVCYCTGTLIRCLRFGREVDIAVEALVVGDLVVTASGSHRPVRWIGRRTIDCLRHPEPQIAWPVRVAQDAFGAGLPSRDLYLSMGHSVRVRLLDDVLVPIYCLLNGATIAPVAVDTVTYWHVELDSHDVIVANGLPAESYIDCGNREFLLEQEGTFDRAKGPHTLADYCLPYIADGAIVAAVRHRLAVRADRLSLPENGMGLYPTGDDGRRAATFEPAAI